MIRLADACVALKCNQYFFNYYILLKEETFSEGKKKQLKNKFIFNLRACTSEAKWVYWKAGHSIPNKIMPSLQRGHPQTTKCTTIPVLNGSKQL